MYWLVNSGTTEDPWCDEIVARYRRWIEKHGDVQMFSVRPAQITVGHRLIHRLVGSPGCELVAVGEVTSAPLRSGHDRWPWAVRRRLLVVCDAPDAAPTAAAAGIAAKGLRMYKALSEEEGLRAETLVAAAGRRFAPV